MTNFDKMLNLCLDLDKIYSDHSKEGGYKLGHYADDLIVLYGVENTITNIKNLKKELDKTKIAYRLIIHRPKEEWTNITIKLV